MERLVWMASPPRDNPPRGKKQAPALLGLAGSSDAGMDGLPSQLWCRSLQYSSLQDFVRLLAARPNLLSEEEIQGLWQLHCFSFGLACHVCSAYYPFDGQQQGVSFSEVTSSCVRWGLLCGVKFTQKTGRLYQRENEPGRPQAALRQVAGDLRQAAGDPRHVAEDLGQLPGWLRLAKLANLANLERAKTDVFQ